MKCLRSPLHVFLALLLVVPAYAREPAAPPNNDRSAAAPKMSQGSGATPIDQEASHAFAEGVRLIEAGEYASAKAAFERAYALSPHWLVLYNIGQCEVRLEQWDPAIRSLERYLAEGGVEIDPEQRAAVTSQLVVLRTRVAAGTEARPEVPALASPTPTIAVPSHGIEQASDAAPAPLQPVPQAEAPNPWGWWVGGTGIVLLGSAAALYLWNDSRYVDWKTGRAELEGMDLAQDTMIWDRANQSNERLASIERIDVLSFVVAVVGAAALGAGVWQVAAARGSVSNAQGTTAPPLGWRATW